MGDNTDLKIELEAQNPRKREREQHEAVKGTKAAFAAGYGTLDKADNSPYGRAERQGMSPSANYRKRWC